MLLLLFFIPGVILLPLLPSKKAGVAGSVALSIGASLAFFVIASWAIRGLNIPLSSFYYAAIAIGCVLLVLLRRDVSGAFKTTSRDDIFVLFIFAVVLVLRFVPMLLQAVPAGGDMSMHGYIARLIFDNNGIPNSYAPLLPISKFGGYPAGFPLLCALISLVGGLGIGTSCLIMTCLAHALVVFGLYFILIRYFDPRTAAISAAAVSLLTRTPQGIIAWGGNPSVLAFFFFLMFFALLAEQRERFYPRSLLLAAIFLAAAFLTHSIICYAGSAMVLLLAIITSNRKKIYFLALAGSYALAGILLLPYLLTFNAQVTRSMIDWARYWHLVSMSSVIKDLIGNIPILLASAYGFSLLLKTQRAAAFDFLAFFFLVAALVLNSKIWLMPMSYVLFPDRAAIFLIVPLTIFFSPVVPKILERGRIACLLLLSVAGIYYGIFYLDNSLSECSVLSDDLSAFEWIKANTPQHSVIRNNYGDSGIWIPALAGRMITNPHSEPIHMDELRANLAKLTPSYVFVGSKKVYDLEFTSEQLRKEPRIYKLVYEKGKAQVWKIEPPQ